MWPPSRPVVPKLLCAPLLATLLVALPSPRAIASPPETVADAAVEPLSLGRVEVVQRAAAQNPQVAAQRAEVVRRTAQRGQAEAARWPDVTLDLGAGPSLRATRVPGTAVESAESMYFGLKPSDLTVTVGGRLQAIQPLYTFGKIDHRIDAAAHGIRAAEAQVRMTRAQVALEALRLYETHLFARDTARFLEEVEHTLQRSIEATADQIASGSPDVGEGDEARLRSALHLARIGLEQARAGVEQTRAGLVAYLDLPADVPWRVADDRLEPAAERDSPLETLVQAALDGRPELAALREGVQAFERLADAERAGFWPNFFAMIDVSGAYTPGRELIDTRYVLDPLYHFFPAVLLGLRWNVQADMPARRADEARAEALRLSELERWARAGIPAEVEVAHRSVLRARRDLVQADEGLGTAKQWVVRASADYSAGFDDSRGVADAVQAYAQLRLAKLDALLRLNVALAELHHATGTLAP